jgi:hypothetical protein
MLLAQPYIIDIDIAKRCKDPFVLTNNEPDRLFIVTEDRPQLTKL